MRGSLGVHAVLLTALDSGTIAQIITAELTDSDRPGLPSPQPSMASPGQTLG